MEKRMKWLTYKKEKDLRIIVVSNEIDKTNIESNRR